MLSVLGFKVHNKVLPANAKSRAIEVHRWRRLAQAKGYYMKDYKTIFEKVESALISAGSANIP